MELSSKCAQANPLQHNTLGDFNCYEQNSNSRHMALGQDRILKTLFLLSFSIRDSPPAPGIVQALQFLFIFLSFSEAPLEKTSFCLKPDMLQAHDCSRCRLAERS